MKATIDGAGRVVIPKAIRDSLGLRPGEEIEIVLSDGRVVIEPIGTPVRLAEERGVLVAVPDGELPPLTAELVRDTIERTRR